MTEPANRSPQPVPVKIVLPRWLTRGIIIFFLLCLVLMVGLVANLFYQQSQDAQVYPAEERRRNEEINRWASENANQKVEELLHPSPTPSPEKKASPGK